MVITLTAAAIYTVITKALAVAIAVTGFGAFKLAFSSIKIAYAILAAVGSVKTWLAITGPVTGGAVVTAAVAKANCRSHCQTGARGALLAKIVFGTATKRFTGCAFATLPMRLDFTII